MGGAGMTDDSEYTSIDPLNLNEEFARFPGQLAHANACVAEALDAFMVEKLRLERIEARLTIEWRERLMDDATAGKGRAPSVDGVRARVVDDQRYVDAYVARNEAEVAYVHARGSAEAVRAKKDMLVSLGANIRAELDGSPHLRAQHQHAHRDD
jgi:hypothetical protein